MKNSNGMTRNREGAVMLLVAAAMVVLFGYVAISVDLGRLYVAKEEARRAVDAATLAAMSAYSDYADTASARAAATTRGQTYMQMNPVQNRTLPADDLTVVANGATKTLEVTITAPLKTTFGQILGISGVTIRSAASGRLASSNAVRCLRPVLVPDYFKDNNGNGYYDAGDYYGTDSTGLGTHLRDDTYVKDFGRRATITLYSVNGPTGSRVYFGSMLLTSNGNATTLISDTTCANGSYTLGQTLNANSGQPVGQVRSGFQNLWNMDPGMVWNSSSQTFTGSSFADWRNSPRAMTVALYDPRTPPNSGTINVVGFAAAVLDSLPGNSSQVFYIRYANIRAVASACTTTCSQMASFVQLTR